MADPNQKPYSDPPRPRSRAIRPGRVTPGAPAPASGYQHGLPEFAMQQYIAGLKRFGHLPADPEAPAEQG